MRAHSLAVLDSGFEKRGSVCEVRARSDLRLAIKFDERGAHTAMAVAWLRPVTKVPTRPSLAVRWATLAALWGTRGYVSMADMSLLDTTRASRAMVMDISVTVCLCISATSLSLKNVLYSVPELSYNK